MSSAKPKVFTTFFLKRKNVLTPDLDHFSLLAHS